MSQALDPSELQCAVQLLRGELASADIPDNERVNRTSGTVAIVFPNNNCRVMSIIVKMK